MPVLRRHKSDPIGSKPPGPDNRCRRQRMMMMMMVHRLVQYNKANPPARVLAAVGASLSLNRSPLLAAVFEINRRFSRTTLHVYNSCTMPAPAPIFPITLSRRVSFSRNVMRCMAHTRLYKRTIHT
jgi:hypothetical protein